MGSVHFPLFTVLLIAILVWMAVGFFSSRITGWASLAQRYRCDELFTGERLRFRSAAMRFWSHYGNCLTMGVNSQGLFLSVSIPFLPGHPPLFIPWNEITACRTRVLWTKCVELRLGREPAIPVRLCERLAAKLTALAGEAWPKEPALTRDPLTRPAPAEENAGAGHPLPHGGEGRAPHRVR
jgi:hypothetical protein